MENHSEEKNKKKKHKSIGPDEDCKCRVCVFTKSQAPGDPYDISKCPKCYSWEDKKNKKIKN